MKFTECYALRCRGPVESLPDEECPVFLLGDFAVANWEDGHSPYGLDVCVLYPAWVEGKRGWLLRRQWDAANGYCASGTLEVLLSFEDGIRLLCEHGKFEAFDRTK